jgi:hypothetical protein
MQELSTNPTLQKPSQFAWRSSIILLIFVLLASAGLFSYQIIRGIELTTLTSAIQDQEARIASGSTDRDVIVAGILSSSTLRPSIQLGRLVSDFRAVASSAHIRLQGFSVADDRISSHLIVTPEIGGADPITTIIALMRARNADLHLVADPISTVAGSPRSRDTAVVFRILPR